MRQLRRVHFPNRCSFVHIGKHITYHNMLFITTFNILERAGGFWPALILGRQNTPLFWRFRSGGTAEDFAGVWGGPPESARLVRIIFHFCPCFWCCRGLVFGWPLWLSWSPPPLLADALVCVSVCECLTVDGPATLPGVTAAAKNGFVVRFFALVKAGNCSQKPAIYSKKMMCYPHIVAFNWGRKGGVLVRERMHISLSPDTFVRLREYALYHHKSASQAITDWIWSVRMPADAGNNPPPVRINDDLRLVPHRTRLH